jgi:hypothetical protein
VLSNASFGKTAQNSSSFWPVESESERTRLVLEPASGSSISNDDLEWIRAKWITGGQLMHRSSEFNLAVQAFDQSAFARDPALALLQLWSALEGVFSPSRSELRFRVSANIATFLEPAGERRAILHRRVAKLYDARSAAAHGRPEQSLEPLVETYSLLKRVLLRIIDDNYVPSISDIESALFGHVKFNTTSTESGAGGES